jgi:quinol monooxygenase YgiN
MEDIRLNGRLLFDPKNFDEVAGICAINARDAREHPGMLEYSFWVNEGKDTIYIHEHYESAEALLNHLQNMDETAVGRLLEIVELGTMECAAESTPESRMAVETLSGFGVAVNHYTLVARR